MKCADIHTGGWYTKDGLFARQVLSIAEKVHYRDFVLESGEPLSTSSLCGLSSFATWCRRTLKAKEIARMRIDEADRREGEKRESLRQLFKFAVDAVVEQQLRAASDEALLAEVRRRGLV